MKNVWKVEVEYHWNFLFVHMYILTMHIAYSSSKRALKGWEYFHTGMEIILASRKLAVINTGTFPFKSPDKVYK